MNDITKRVGEIEFSYDREVVRDTHNLLISDFWGTPTYNQKKDDKAFSQVVSELEREAKRIGVECLFIQVEDRYYIPRFINRGFTFHGNGSTGYKLLENDRNNS